MEQPEDYLVFLSCLRSVAQDMGLNYNGPVVRRWFGFLWGRYVAAEISPDGELFACQVPRYPGNEENVDELGVWLIRALHRYCILRPPVQRIIIRFVAPDQVVPH